MRTKSCSIIVPPLPASGRASDAEETQWRQRIRPLLEELIALAEAEDVCHFLVTASSSPELWTAEAVLDLVRHRPHLSLECVVPGLPGPDRLSPGDRLRRVNLLAQCTQVTTIQQCTPDRTRACRRYLADHSGYVLTVQDFPLGAGLPLRYTLRRGRAGRLLAVWPPQAPR